MARDCSNNNSRCTADGELEEVRVWMFESSLPGVSTGSRRATDIYGEGRANSTIHCS